jgi:hypothetical protein
VFARISFLLALGLLILIAFYFAGLYLLILPLSIGAPSLVRPAAGLAVLAAVGVTVQLLSMAMGSLRGIALYPQGERPGIPAYLSQGFFLMGHIASFYFAAGLLVKGEPIAQGPLLLIAGLYLTGAVLAIHEWRRRKMARR